MVNQSIAAAGKRTIWNPVIDFLGLGGLSVIVAVFAMLMVPASHEWLIPYSRALAAESGRVLSKGEHLDSLTVFWLLTIALNHPHFMASYRLLYRSREQVRTYPWSSMRVPALLGIISIVVLLSGGELVSEGGQASSASSSVGDALYWALNVGLLLYLGWHYNMQAWGIICTYLFLGEVRINSREKWMIRSGLLVLVGVHGLLWLASSPLMLNEQFSRFCISLTPFVPFIVWPFFIMGGLGFYGAAKRTGKRVPVNAIVPWVAIYVWYYAVMGYYDIVGVMVLVQLAHALQYLVVTTRVEANVAHRRSRKSGLPATAGIYIALLAVGYLVFELPGIVGMDMEFAQSYYAAIDLLAISINLHHFFVDGAIWKISNPAVRRDLFAHLEA